MLLINNETEYGLLPLIISEELHNVHIFVNGFMSDENDDLLHREWLNAFKFIIKDKESVFLYKWPSGIDHFKLKNHNPIKKGDSVWRQIKDIAVLASLRINPIVGTVFTLGNVALNIHKDWKNSNKESIEYGSLLANKIEKMQKENDKIKIYLYAHSLGANLVRHTMLKLIEKNISIEKVYLFGGASCSLEQDEWAKISNNVKYGLYNFYTPTDLILKKLYKLAENKNEPIGLLPIRSNMGFKIFNYDVTSIIGDDLLNHMAYKKNIPTIFRLNFL